MRSAGLEEIIDYAKAETVDAPSGTVRELAEALGEVTQNKVAIPVKLTARWKREERRLAARRSTRSASPAS
jgi:dihydrodipicolinate reductase